jgi:FkbM family methyltransferase
MFGNQVNALEIFVDIGAWEPVSDSVSHLFIEMGWKTILIEPQVYYYQKSAYHYKKDLGVKVIHAAVSCQPGLLSLFVPEVTTGWASISEKHAMKMQESMATQLVNAITLDQIHLNIGLNYFILKIDAEESEKDILEGWQSGEIGPIIICIKGDNEVIKLILESRSFKLFFFDGINQYFIKASFYKAVNSFNPVNLFEDSVFTISDSAWLVNTSYGLKNFEII